MLRFEFVMQRKERKRKSLRGVNTFVLNAYFWVWLFDKQHFYSRYLSVQQMMINNKAAQEM